MKQLKIRNINIDLIKMVALISVISVHFFLHNGFYSEPVMGRRMYCMVVMRTAFMVCVPLFIITTGYLMSNKELSKHYYKGILRTMEVYVVSTILWMFFQRFYFKSDISIKRELLSIFGDYVGYSWYVEMYIGLFLLIPFLNIVYHGLISKKRKQWLIVTLLFCCVLPSALNIFDFFTPEFWIHPIVSSNYFQLVPDWWKGIYPLLYYFIGAYIREYNIKVSFKKNLIFTTVCVLLFGTYNFYRSYGGSFETAIYTDWASFENVIDSVLIFLLLVNVDLNKMPMKIKRIIVKISELSFGAYLVSSIVDNAVYPILNENVKMVVFRLEWFCVIVPIIFMLSIVLSQIVNWVCDLLGNSSKLVKNHVENQGVVKGK